MADCALAGKILGLFLFGTERVQEFLDKGFTFISLGNDLHHGLTQGCAHLGALANAPPHEPLAPSTHPTCSRRHMQHDACVRTVVVDPVVLVYARWHGYSRCRKDPVMLVEAPPVWYQPVGGRLHSARNTATYGRPPTYRR